MTAITHFQYVFALMLLGVAAVSQGQASCGEGTQLTMGKLNGQAQLSADGGNIVLAAGEQAVLCDARTGAIIRGYNKEGTVSKAAKVALSSDGAYAGAVYQSGEGVLWDAATGEVLLQTGRRNIDTFYHTNNSLLKITTNGWFIVGGTEFFDVFEIATRTRLDYRHIGVVRDVADDGTRFVVRHSAHLRVIDSATWTTLSTLEGSDAVDLSSQTVAFSSDGSRIAMISGNLIYLWDAATGGLIGSRSYTREIVESMDWQASAIVACNESNLVSIISPSTLREVGTLQSPGPVNLVGVSGDGKRLWFHSQLMPRSNGPEAGEIRVHDVPNGALVHPFHGGSDYPAAVNAEGTVAYTPLLTNSTTTDYIQYSVLAWQRGRTAGSTDLFTRNYVEELAIAVTPDGTELMANNRIYDLQTGSRLRDVTMGISLSEAAWAQFGPAGRFLMIEYGNAFFIFDTLENRPALSSSTALSFVPMYADTAARLSGSTLEFVSLLTGSVVGSRALPYSMTRIVFNQQGSNLLAGINASDLVVVDLSTGDQTQRIAPPRDESFHVIALSPDGKLAAATTRKAEVVEGLGRFTYNQHLFSVDSGELLATFDPLRARPMFTPLGDALLWVGPQVIRYPLTACPEGEGAAEGEAAAEGNLDGEGSIEEGEGGGAMEGEGNMEGGALEGEAQAEGEEEGEGQAEGNQEGEGAADGEAEADGEGTAEGAADGEGEGADEGEGEGGGMSGAAAEVLAGFALADTNGDRLLSLMELTAAFPGLAASFDALDTNGSARVALSELQQLVESGSPIHSADTNADSLLALAEVLRVIQLRNAGGYTCAADAELTEDGYTPTAGSALPNGCRAHASDYQQTSGVISLGELLRLVQLYNSAGIAPCSTGEDGYCTSSR